MERRVDSRFDELKRHFDMVAEQFRTEFNNLFDRAHATTSRLGERVDRLAENHRARLDAVELRVDALEKRRRSQKPN